MAVLNFIIDNILINAAVILGLVALLGLILQRKSVSECISGTFKTMMGFMILSSGSSVIVGALEPFSTWFSAGLGIQGSVPPSRLCWLWPCRTTPLAATLLLCMQASLW